MICQKCKAATASVCITQTVNSRKTDIYLCRSCANEAAAVSQLKAALGLFDLLPGPMAFGADHERHIKQTSGMRCPGCGVTIEEIQQSGWLGCAECYTIFKPGLRPIITRIHRSAQHRGKSPTGWQSAGSGAGSDDGVNGTAGEKTVADAAAPQTEQARSAAAPQTEQARSAAERLAELKALLAGAIRDEKYERAAELRDMIKEIEAGI